MSEGTLRDHGRRTPRTTGISLSFAVLVVALGCDARSPSAPTPTPAPATKYNLSGIVTDDIGSPVANAQLTLHYFDNSYRSANASTDASGRYNIAFETSRNVYDGNTGIVGVILYTGGGEYENYVQAVPWGTADIVKNLRLRRVRTLNAGESMIISIDPDSSLAYDEDFLRMDWVSERFHVRVADAGVLTISARPEVDGVVPQMGVYCWYVTDNCGYEYVGGIPDFSSGTRTLWVNANSLFEIRLAISSYVAPQRYEIVTSRQ
jgi:hypothetical protein